MHFIDSGCKWITFRKLTGMLLILALVLSLAGCKKNEAGVSVPANSDMQAASDVVTTITPSVADSGAEGTDNTPVATGNSKNENEAADGSNADLEPAAPESEKTFIVVLDPGHGANFSGAVYDKRVEKELTLKIADYAKQYLEANTSWITVLMTREDDNILSSDVVEDLELRAEFAKKNGADLFVSFHLNASDKHDQNGGMVLISHRANVTDASAALGKSILSEIEALGIANRGLVTRNSSDHFDENGQPLEYYAINRHCANRDIPGIIVEHCFIDGNKDISFIDSEEDLKLLGEADAKGIVAYLETLR